MKEFAKKYLSYLETDLKGINLTRITGLEDFYNKQIIDSILPLRESERFKADLEKTELLVDIGFGGGFPIIPLAFNLKDKKNYKFLGMEARAKKALAVTQISNYFDLKNCKLIHQRLDDVFFDKSCIITLKAVGKVDDFLSKINTNKSLYVYFYKGPNFYELEDLSEVLLNWDIVEEKSINVPGTDGRLIVGFKNKNVLRGTQKNLVKLSQLL